MMTKMAPLLVTLRMRYVGLRHCLILSLVLISLPVDEPLSLVDDDSMLFSSSDIVYTVSNCCSIQIHMHV